VFTETVNDLTTVSGERPDISRQINEALKNPSSRIDAVNDFFHRNSGEGFNYGLDVVGFMEWERVRTFRKRGQARLRILETG
jgi:hypothetical protein